MNLNLFKRWHNVALAHMASHQAQTTSANGIACTKSAAGPKHNVVIANQTQQQVPMASREQHAMLCFSGEQQPCKVIYPWILLSIMLSFYTSVDQIIPFPSQRSMIAPIRWIAGTMQALSKMVLKVSIAFSGTKKKKRETQAPQGDP